MQISNKKKEYLNKTKIKFYKEIKKYSSKLKPTKEIEGYPCSVILGEKGYPNINSYNISNQENNSSYTNTSKLVKNNYDNIIKIKAKNILAKKTNTYIKKTNDKILNEITNIYKAKKPIMFTSKFENELQFNKILINKVSGILGSKNELKNITINENTPTSKQIEKYSQNDIRAKEAIINLYEKNINEHQIINLLSLGTFGNSINKKLVPSKWAITAYDQTIEKHLHKKIINYKIINKYEIYHHFDKGNTFIIILFPENYRSEIIESFPGAIESDYVNFDNKLQKKEPETAGGYYATKLAIFEKLNSIKKQASYISIRIINNYELPLGVVFVRESIREAMNKKIFKTNNISELEIFLQKKFPNHFKLYQKSKFIKEKKIQKKLNEFFI